LIGRELDPVITPAFIPSISRIIGGASGNSLIKAIAYIIFDAFSFLPIRGNFVVRWRKYMSAQAYCWAWVTNAIVVWNTLCIAKMLRSDAAPAVDSPRFSALLQVYVNFFKLPGEITDTL
jgi:hypothetical protein